MARFRKRPVEVNAEQFHLGLDPECYPIGVEWGGDLPDGTGCYVVITIHGQKTCIQDGDWIITEPDGVHHYPCRPDIFETTYEKVDDDEPV